MADLCEKVGANVQEVAKGIGLDGRIGSKFLHAGPGYGGSCFPKDTLALVRTAQQFEAPTKIVEAVVEINDDRKKAMATRVKNAMGGSLNGKTVAVLGLTFKPNTDDMRDSPSLDIIPALVAEGATVRGHDPIGMEEAKKHFGDTITWCSGAYDAMAGADCAMIITEWDIYRALAPAKIKELLKQPVLVDLRNIYRPDMMAEERHRLPLYWAPICRAQEINATLHRDGLSEHLVMNRLATTIILLFALPIVMGCTTTSVTTADWRTAKTETPSKTVQLYRDQDGLFFVRAFVNGQGPFWFQLDTGAGVSAITTSTANILGIDYSDAREVMVHGMAFAGLRPRIEGQNITIGGTSFSDVPMVIIQNRPPGEDFHGIIGIDLDA